MVRKVENKRRIKEMSMRQGGYEKGTDEKQIRYQKRCGQRRGQNRRDEDEIRTEDTKKRHQG